ncbi:MAG: aminotransferase class III-fold pyridoxal phosphate-dependent enzyme [Woeseiaceae bacterium]
MLASPDIKFLDRDPPDHPLAEVRELAVQLYGLEGRISQLSGERDQNFLLEADNDRRFVLKVANSTESAEVVGLQIAALRHIATTAPSLPVPRIVQNTHDLDAQHVLFANGCEHIVYLLTFLDGTLLSEHSGTGGKARLRRLGVLMADIDLSLRGFFHPAAMQQHPWNFESCGRLQPLTMYIESEDDRAIVDQVFVRMRDVVIPRLLTQRHQVIHQDAHADNLLLETQDPAKFAGLIDFGDLLFGTLAAEVAVACDGVTEDHGDMAGPSCEVVAAYDSVLPLEESELDLVFDLMCARNAMTATIGYARAARTPEQAAHIAAPLRYIERLRALQSTGKGEFSSRLRRACRFPAYCPRSPDEALAADDERRLVESRYTLLGRRSTHFYARPMHFERASGPWLYGTDGHRYLDCYNNVPQVGHCHPHVVKAIARQAATLNTNTRYLYSSAIEYADRITEKLAPHLTACIFVNSGSEANDVAWQMAKLVTGKTGALIMEDAYHGVTDVIRQFSPGRPDAALPDFLKGLIVPDPYRGPYREDDGNRVEKYVADADRAIAELHDSGHGTAAFMIDSALCSSGVPDTPDGYMRGVEKRIREAGGLMICDEVQSGFGRMGQWWGHEHHGVRADIVTMGKPVGNGYPLGVVATTDEILNLFIDKIRLFSTYGGNTVACAAGNAVLDVIEQEALIENGRKVGQYLREQLSGLANKHDLIGDVRGHGMVCGVEFVVDRESRQPATQETARLVELMREQRVLVGSEGRDANILKLRPALIFRPEHVDRFIDALDTSLRTL